MIPRFFFCFFIITRIPGERVVCEKSGFSSFWKKEFRKKMYFQTSRHWKNLCESPFVSPQKKGTVLINFEEFSN